MALIQSSRQSSGGGGGDITGAQNDQFVQVANFAAGTLTLSLTQTPFDQDNIILDYNGQVKRKGTDWTFTGPNTINILFGDPYVTDYDSPPYFQAAYLY